MNDNMQEMIVWGRNFELDIDFDCFPGEDISDMQRLALEKFIETGCVNEVETEIKDYCLRKNRDEIKEESIENIFRYVIPESIYVVNESEKRIVALMCEYKFDIEHGLAIVFENEHLQAIGPQDVIL